MINCPKCGFNQPKDRYCANCGVDIDNYRPPKQSAGLSLFRNIYLQLFIAIAVVFTAASIVIGKRTNLTERIGFFSSNTTLSKARNNIAPSANQLLETESTIEDGTDASNLEPADDALLTGEKSLSANPGGVNSDQTGSNGSPSATGAQKTNNEKAERHVRLFISEIKSEDLALLMDDSRKKNLFSQIGDFTAGISGLTSKMISPSNPGAHIWINETKRIDLNVPVDFKYGNNLDTESGLGLAIRVNLQDFDGVTFSGELEVLRQWKNSNDSSPPERVNFPTSFEITKENGFFVAGLIPHQSSRLMEQSLANVPVFQAMHSENFKSRLSELVLVIEFDNTAN